MITVIADDITGAAEIAGIAKRYNVAAKIITIDSRSMNATEAKAAVTEVACGLKQTFPAKIARKKKKGDESDKWHSPETPYAFEDFPMEGSTVSTTEKNVSNPHEEPATHKQIILQTQGQDTEFDILFIKVDSALRGNVEAETEAIMSVFPGYNHAVYMPANPSKGRVILNGIYYINGTPLSNTPFAYDPEFPARSSRPAARFTGVSGNLTIVGGNDALNIGLPSNTNTYDKTVLLPDAITIDDIENIVKLAKTDTLFLGAADLFEACLHRLGYKFTAPSPVIGKAFPFSSNDTGIIIVCGSTQSKPVPLNIRVAHGHNQAMEIYAADRRVVLAAKKVPSVGGELARARHIKMEMARTVAEIARQYELQDVVIEGGATAFAICRAAEWTHFNVEAEIAPGVVRLTTDKGPRITLKPGSYPWNAN